MAWYYRCNVSWLDLNDLLNKTFDVTVVSTNQLSQSFAALLATNEAYRLIKEYKDTPPHPNATKADYEIELTSCEEREEQT
jgi:hypothetical protein